MPVPAPDPVVYVHIGPPKTGTTYLQAVLWHNRAKLAANGLAIPKSDANRHFKAALDLRGLDFQGHADPRRTGEWPRLAAAVDRGPGKRSLISHEIFGGSAPEQIDRLVDDLAPAEVHVVYGARDVARQLPAVYQETIKNRGKRTFGAHVDKAIRQLRDDKVTSGFWRSQHQPATLARWAQRVPVERIHIVTLPQRGAAPDLLWQRFCQAVGVPSDGYDLDVTRANPSLSTEDTEVLRLLNAALPPPEQFPWPQYSRRVKKRFNTRADSGSPGTRLTVPLEFRDELAAHTERVKKELADAGYDIIGSIDDLDPAESSFGPTREPDYVHVSEAATQLLAELIVRGPRGGRQSESRARRVPAKVGEVVGRFRGKR